MGDQLDAWYDVLFQVPIKQGRRTHTKDGDNVDNLCCGGAMP